ncbi:MAG: VOC family protein [Thermomicrobiales bacterium]
MAIYRVVPNLQTGRVDDNRAFYVDFLGFDQLMDLGWIATYGSPEVPTAQISVIERDATAPMLADVSIEVDDVDAYYAEAIRHRVEIVYGPADEPWGVRRFFVRDPNGKVINIVAHRGLIRVSSQ